jgi:TP901 family phage tail tape measure protein
VTDRTVTTRLRLEFAQYAAGLTKLGAGTRALASETAAAATKNSESFKKIGLAAGVASGAILLGLGKAVSAAASFDKAMSAVGAAANASSKDLAALRVAALEAGKATAFSASESAAAEESLVKAGVSVGDVLGGALAGSLDLAAAGNQSVAESAETAAAAMVQFGLSGGDVVHVADVLAAGAGKAQGEVSDFSQALVESGAVANQMGQSLEDTVGALALFASYGLTGQNAGTSFKQMLLSLTPTSKQAADAMSKYGLAFFDSAGNAKSFTEIAGELHDKLGGLSQEQQTLALRTIFGADAFRVAGYAMQAGADGAADWKKKVDDAGFAGEQAAKKMDNLAGDLEQLRGSIETALIEGGSSATGVLRAMTQAATGVVNEFSDLPGPIGGAIFGLTALSGAGLGILGLAGTLIPRLQDAKRALSDMGRAGELAGTGIGWAAKGGVYAVGIATFAEGLNALSHVVDRLVRGKADVDGLSAALVRLAEGQKGAFGDVTDLNRGPDNQLKQYIELVKEGELTAKQANLGKWLDDLDKSFAKLVNNGAPDAAAEALKRYAAALDLTPADLKPYLTDYTSALDDTTDAATVSKAAQKELNDSIGDGKDPIAEATDEITKYAAAAVPIRCPGETRRQRRARRAGRQLA